MTINDLKNVDGVTKLSFTLKTYVKKKKKKKNYNYILFVYFMQSWALVTFPRYRVIWNGEFQCCQTTRYECTQHCSTAYSITVQHLEYWISLYILMINNNSQ